MDRKTLVLISTICGAVMVVALLFFPLQVREFGEESEGMRAIQGGSGPWLLLFTWLACGFSGIVLVNKADYLGVGDEKARMLAFLGYKLANFFFFAHLIAGTGHDKISWGFGYWLAFIAAIAGNFVIYLTFNPALAQKIADKSKEVREKMGTDDQDGGSGGDDTPQGESTPQS